MLFMNETTQTLSRENETTQGLEILGHMDTFWPFSGNFLLESSPRKSFPETPIMCPKHQHVSKNWRL